jgi:predicted tellurium resistance membrane protein TerC
LTAGWVLQFWQFEVLGAAYLLWLVYKHFTSATDDEEHHHGPRFASLWQAIPVIAFTDLAFSLDSVTTAIALSQEIFVILLGGTIGIITLRFMAGYLFAGWKSLNVWKMPGLLPLRSSVFGC